MSIQANILNRLCQHLSTALQAGNLRLSTNSGDGRVNSQASEKEISNALLHFSQANEWFHIKRALNIEIARERYWYDFAVSGRGLFIPVNVKVSSFQGSDNLSSKEGVFYALTGVDPHSVTINTWEKFCARLHENLGRDPNADYYFVIVNKQEVGDVFWTSLKSICQLDANGNNPPFQCNWSKNRDRIQRSEAEAQDYILSVLGSSFRLRAEAWNSFQQYFGH
ncbi:hypothetical protein [Uliginosibacterium gangwonense]|uniref:hypothetical protein n=1 Tax=Uliginosibacterium gangwonense TaxID=392736 RepID=UPI00035D08FA|nr:hypothetical protein [Uliginosibacterium gangwonense]